MECSICLREYSENHPKVDPRVLGCGHTLCLDCIKQSLSSHSNLQCPFDRKTFNKINPDKLPRNFGLIEHIESITTLKMQLKAQEEQLKLKEGEEDQKNPEIFTKIEKMQKKITKQQKKLERIIRIQEAMVPDIIIDEKNEIPKNSVGQHNIIIHIKPNEAERESNFHREFQDIGMNSEQNQSQDLAVEESKKIESKKEILLPLALFFMIYCLVFLPFVLK